MPEYEDREMTCQMKGCGTPFTWTAGEQKFMDSLVAGGKIAKANVPKRCAPCREKKRQHFASQD